MFSHLTDVHAANRPLLAALVMILEASLISAILSWTVLIVIWDATPLVPEPDAESLIALFLTLWLLAALPSGVTVFLTRDARRPFGGRAS